MTFYEPATLVDRLRGHYRVSITDGLGPAGGEEPNNPNEFVRTFPTTPIQIEAARYIEELHETVRGLRVDYENEASRADEIIRNGLSNCCREDGIAPCVPFESLEQELEKSKQECDEAWGRIDMLLRVLRPIKNDWASARVYEDMLAAAAARSISAER